MSLCLLGVIAYNTGAGKILPVHRLMWMSCDSKLSRSLFYSTLLRQSEDLSELATQVKAAETIEAINQMVVNGSNINASRTIWFESVSDPGKCQAQVFLKHPNKDGENTAYFGFEVSGFADPHRNWIEQLQGGQVLQSIQVDMIGVKWFKE